MGVGDKTMGKYSWNEMKQCVRCHFRDLDNPDYCKYINKDKPAPIMEGCPYGEIEETWQRHKEANEKAFRDLGKEEYLKNGGEYDYHRYILEDNPL